MAMERELLKSLAKKPVTLRYPFERLKPVERLRGRLDWSHEKCVGCGVCVSVCPAFALEMLGKGLTAEITFHLDRCTFCAQCEESCPKEAISLTSEYELASDKHVVIEFKRPTKEG